LQLQIL